VIEWKAYKFSDFLTRVKTPLIIDDLTKYKRVTIKTKHGGVSVRDIAIGVNIGTKKQFILKKGQFILSKIDARYGAFGIAPSEVDGAIITRNFWAYNSNKDIISIEWLDHFTNSPSFYDFCERASSGITHRKYLNEAAFLNNEIFLPPIENQDEILLDISSRRSTAKSVLDELTHQQTLLKQLRQQILQEAIEGKLTNDWRADNIDVEPASESLKCIQAEKEQLVKGKKIKKQKPLLPISKEEKPFELPVRWEWCRLEGVMDYLTDYHANGAYEKLKNNVQLLDEPNFAIMLRTTNFHHKSRLKYKYITRHAYDFLSKSKVYPEDVIMNKIADPGAVFFVDDRKRPMSLAMSLFLLRFNQQYIASKYVYFYLKATYEYVVSFSSGTATPTITKDAVKNLRFPLPPLPEQKAIVTKVEKLLAVCDKLETQITHNQTHAEQLMQAVLKEAFSQNSEQVKEVAVNA